MNVAITLRVDEEGARLTIDTRTTLLDAMRERLGITRPEEGLRSRPVRSLYRAA